MSTPDFLNPAFSLRLLETLCHFLWQGTVIALLVAAAWPPLRRASAARRCHVLVASLLAMALCPVATFSLIRAEAPRPPGFAPAAAGRHDRLIQPLPDRHRGQATQQGHAAATASPTVPLLSDRGGTTRPSTRPTVAAAPPNAAPPPAAPTGSYFAQARPYAPYAAGFYAAGVFAFLARLLLALAAGQHLRRAARPVDDPGLLGALQRGARALGLRAVPKLAYCTRLVEPAVVGVLRPTILLPVALAAGLTPAQVEAILAHELAHIRRWDHWVNVVQRVIEAFLFFHPAVWFVSNRIRREREHCCDDLAAACAGGGKETDMGRIGYADSIVRAAELIRAARRSARDRYPVASVAATGSGKASHLRTRIVRLLDASFREELPMGRGAAAVLVIALGGLFALAVRLPARAAGPAGAPAAAAAPATRPTTGPAATSAQAAQAALDRLRPRLPTGWSLRAKEGVLSIRRDKGISFGGAGAGPGLPGAPSGAGGAPHEAHQRLPYRIDLRFEEPITPEEFRRRLSEHRRGYEILEAAPEKGRALIAAHPVPDLFDVEGGSGHGIHVSVPAGPQGPDGAPGFGGPFPGGGHGGGFVLEPVEQLEIERVWQEIRGAFRREPAGVRPWVDRLRSLGPFVNVSVAWLPPGDVPRPHVTGVVLGERLGTQAAGEQRFGQLQRGESSKLLDLLAEQGFFEKAKTEPHPGEPAGRADKGRSRVLISVIGEQYNQPPIYLWEQLPLDEKAVARLTQIGKGLGGDPAAAVGALLAEIESQSEPWVPAGPGPAPAGAAPGRQGLPGHDHH